MRSHYLALLLAGLLPSVGCPSSEGALSVDLRTDLVPELELGEVELTIETLDLRRAVAITGTDVPSEGIRLARFEGLDGRHTLRATFFDRAGNRIGRRRVTVRVRGETATTVVFTRSCLSVRCPGEDPSETECLNGLCVPPECSPETPDACGEGFCLADAECPAPAASCARARCREGACLDVAGMDACPEGQVCEPETACVPIPGAALCPTLPAAEGLVTVVGPARTAELPAIFDAAAPGETILFEDGRYDISAFTGLQIAADNVTVRSASNNAGAVVIDGGGSSNAIFSARANNVTFAHLTIEHAQGTGVLVAPRNETYSGLRVYNVISRDHGGWHVQAVPWTDATSQYHDSGEIACSEFSLSDEGRPNVRIAGCNTGGVRLDGGQGWRIRDNRFEGFHCDGTGAANPVIWTRRGARDTTIERNTILDSSRGISLGLFGDSVSRIYVPDPYPDTPSGISDYDGLVRANVVYSNLAIYETGIEIASARGARVFHNTVVSGDGATERLASIDVRGDTQATLANNLVRSLSTRDGGTFEVAGVNLEDAPLSMFVDAAAGDLRLRDDADDAIDQGVSLSEGGLDIDGQRRDSQPDLGADEL